MIDRRSTHCICDTALSNLTTCSPLTSPAYPSWHQSTQQKAQSEQYLHPLTTHFYSLLSKSLVFGFSCSKFTFRLQSYSSSNSKVFSYFALPLTFTLIATMTFLCISTKVTSLKSQSDLKQTGTQNKKPFYGLIFHAVK